MKERIQEASKPDASCSVFIGMVGRELHDKKKHHNATNEYTGCFFYWSALKNDRVSDYIVNPIKKVLSVRIS